MKEVFEFLATKLFSYHGITITVGSLVGVFAILFIGNFLFLAFIRFILKPYFKRKDVDEGRVYSITTLLRYIFYILLFLFAIQFVGIKLSVLWTGIAALMVGVGLGLQQTFNDFASGIILLIEGSIQKGDWLVVEGQKAMVKEIGLRTSKVVTQDNKYIIVPNSKITVDSVVNLSHNDEGRMVYTVDVGVAYGSDTVLVKNLLLDAAKNHPAVCENPPPFVRFTDFADSSLNFTLLYWSEDYTSAENNRSDIRFAIDKTFRENKIEIPFPQQDVYIKRMP